MLLFQLLFLMLLFVIIDESFRAPLSRSLNARAVNSSALVSIDNITFSVIDS